MIPNTVPRKTMLSTKENPFNPFEDFESWRRYDIAHNNRCCEILARVAFTSNFLSDENNDLEIENAIDSLLEHDPTNRFIKVIESTT